MELSVGQPPLVGEQPSAEKPSPEQQPSPEEQPVKLSLDSLVQCTATPYREYSIETSDPPDLRIFHFNDVYHVEASSHEPVGGAPRFQTMRNFHADSERYVGHTELLTFFSGDAFNPSLESTITKGKHMVPVLNDLGTFAACLGNHDLDFGVEQFQHLAKQCSFPWLCSNVLDPSLGVNIPLGNCQRTAMITTTNGIKVGLLGLVEQEWLDTINFLPPDLRFIEPSVAAKELVPDLRARGADIIIVLAHQRMYNDKRLAQEVTPGMIDIILGGHDHTYEFAEVNGIPIVRSGSDFKQFSYIEARRHNLRWDFIISRQDVLSSIPEDANSLKMITAITEALKVKLEKPVGYTQVPLDGRFTTVRARESNLGNLICDLLRLHYKADCSIVCAGTIRGDQIYPAGVLKVKDIVDCLPFEDTCVVVVITGKTLVEALENGVSKWPAFEGRFPQVSGISFAFDPKRPSGDRCSGVKVKGLPVQPDKEYTLATRDYMTAGKDGYHMLMDAAQGGKAKVAVTEESGIMLSMLVRQYFMSLIALGRWRNWSQGMDDHWQRLQAELNDKATTHGGTIPMSASNDNVQAPLSPRTKFRIRNGLRLWRHDGSFELSDSEEDAKTTQPGHDHEQANQDRLFQLAKKALRKWWQYAGEDLVEEPHGSLGIRWTKAIAPQLEGRIRIL